MHEEWGLGAQRETGMDLCGVSLACAGAGLGMLTFQRLINRSFTKYYADELRQCGPLSLKIVLLVHNSISNKFPLFLMLRKWLLKIEGLFH